MAKKVFPQSQLPIRKTVELLPTVFQTPANDKFLSGVLDPFVQPGVLQKSVGYIGRRYGKTYNGKDIYLDTDETLRSRYQLEPGVVYNNQNKIENFYDYLDFKNQLQFFGNLEERDDHITSQTHYTWNPPIDWDKFVNYREYYWEPSGPPSISVSGQKSSVTSTYKVTLGTDSSFIFSPDGYTNNPTLTLYRGQTYKFNVNAPTEGFVIRTNYDVGSLLFDPDYSYSVGSRVVFDNKLWQAKVTTRADGSTIDIDSQEWEFIEDISSGTALDYDNGVTNNRIQNGILTFKVPYDSPDVLFYQSVINPDRFGRMIIADIESNTYINVDKEIVGKINYTSSNGVTFTNGLVVEFVGKVSPSKYSSDTWLVEGVGKEITLTRFADLVVPVLDYDIPEVLFDNEGFDTQPFDDASAYPGKKDYITINRNSKDTNPWSRYNRWFHRSVLEYSYAQRGQDFPATETERAKRPIIEFQPNLQLFNHGSVAKTVVDYIDTYTSDVFSNIEGSSGYNIDGEFLFQGARILVIADTDSMSNNKIYEVNFVTHNGKTQISLTETLDTNSTIGDCVLIRRGINNGGKMYHFNGTSWAQSQQKTDVNQSPLFDAFDSNGISFSDVETYPVSTFSGSKIVSYKIGNTGITDSELGFKLSYLNIDNVGDIQFEWNWETETFSYTQNFSTLTKKISTGFYKLNPLEEYNNGWIELDNTYIQPIIDSTRIIESNTSVVEFSTIDWEADTDAIINFYLNGIKIIDSYSRVRNRFTFSRTFSKNDVISIKVIANVPPVSGYYEIPVGLEKNPLNQSLSSFTLGQAIDHISTAIEFDNSFSGTLPGVSNLRDLDSYQQRASRFLKHSGLTPLAISLLCDKTSNIIKSIQFGKKSYTEFKNNFLTKAIELEYNERVIDFVDDIVAELTRAKTAVSPFSGSDMIGAGAFTAINYTVEDVGIRTFSLSQQFSLNELSQRAVYVYLNNSQLLHGRDYTFNSTFGFVTISKSFVEGDKVEIREYISTSTNHIPPTPTSMGLYKKYTPMKFLDDTYVEPRYVIQGHDGSITTAYNDYRDDILLELEYRIYNNIKREYDEKVFDIDSIIGGYYGNAQYTPSQLNGVVNQEFLKWIQNTNINYTINSYFDSEDSFTYTYSNMTDPTGTQNIPGWWRGVYQYFYDTDRPHRCPWEMLGFSEQPTWWEAQYGAAPYTKNNLLLWEDLRDGIIRQGTRAGNYARYARPTLMQHLPIDGNGNLLSPLDSGLAGNFTLINNRGSFALGDISPVEYAWRSSSEWPFAISMALCLLKPFEYITDSFDTSKITTNILGQIINADTGIFPELDNFTIPTDNTPTSGLIKYLVGYVKSRGIDVSTISSKISNLDVNLSTRMSGFVDKAQQRYLLDSKSPKSASSSIFIPAENYDIIFNISSPITSIDYSGVILEKSEGGWIVTGYDDIHPYFSFFTPLASQADPVMAIGGVSESFVDWESDKIFANGQIAKYNKEFYRALNTHTSTSSFDNKHWKKLAKIPTVGGVEAQRRRTFNTLSINKLSYGTKLTSVQQVVDLLLGYEAYLISRGIKFDNYDPENQSSQDWTTSCKEFMFWTKHNWANGSLITLSPAAQKLDITVPVGVADNLLDGFYDYQVLKADGQPLAPEFLNVNRSFQNITIETTNTTDGIFYLKVFYVLKEHVTVFNDRTVFNDVIYDKTTGYRQNRIKTQGFRTVDWDGDYTSPGFLFDNVNIAAWEPFKDYRLGDIVAYRSYNWTSLVNQLGVETFDDSKWSKLDSTPEKQLISNFDYKINQFEDYYNVASEGNGDDRRALARHAIGYQTREYLQNLSEDAVTQFQLYQGFIREKGTSGAITKVFDKLSRSGDSSIILNEEWAFRLGNLGGVDQISEVEIGLLKDRLQLNPQPILLTPSLSATESDQHYRITRSDFTVEPSPFTFNISPTSLSVTPLRSAGYVLDTQVDHVVATRDDILDLDINQINENDHIWITFDNVSWNVLRANESQTLIIRSVTKTDTEVTVTLNTRHSLQIDDIIGINRITNLEGFFRVVSVTPLTFTISVSATAQTPILAEGVISNIKLLTVARFENYESMDPQATALLKNNSKLWVDNNGTGVWEVVQKKKQFSSKSISDYGITTPSSTGYKVIYSNDLRQAITSMPSEGYVMVYTESSTGLSLKQILGPQSGFESAATGSFGMSMALTPDSKYLIVGTPLASGINSNYKGEFSPTAVYSVDDVVLYAGQLYTAVSDVFGDGSSITLDSQDWTITKNIPAFQEGTAEGYFQQGMISIYKFVNQQWVIDRSFVSPRPSNNELFGSSIAVGQVDNNYVLAVSAIGSLNSTGKVYLYEFDGVSWNHKLQSSLPHSQSVDADDSTIQVDILSNVAEMIKEGDEFGFSITMSKTGNVLVIGSPKSDGQYFENYKGIWNASVDYAEGEVVKFNDFYYKLGQRAGELDDSTTRSLNENPESLPWQQVGDSTLESSGKVFIYQLSDTNEYLLAQTITAGSLSSFSDISDDINVGDEFGFALDIDYSGSTLVITSPRADINLQNQGSAYVLKTDSLSTIEYRIKQKLESFETYPNEFFGQSVSISANTEKIVIGAKNTHFSLNTIFDTASGTIFDDSLTTFVEVAGFAGGVYVFENKDNAYFLTEKLETVLSPFESFGFSVDCTDSVIAVGSPKYSSYTVENGQLVFDNVQIGNIRLFRKDTSVSSFEIIATQSPLVDIEKIRSISLYDNVRNVKIQDVDFVDHAKLKILNVAEQELRFKTIYDPAVYYVGTDEQIVDQDTAWAEKNVGALWWNLSTAKWKYYEQGDLTSRLGNWNALAEGASIDVYEWVESVLLPNEWAALADTNEGLSEGISGQPLYPNNDVYSIKEFYNSSTGEATGTKYYYWVKNKVTIPSVTGRRLSSSEVAAAIRTPGSLGIAFIAIIDSDKFLAYNFDSVISSDTALLNIEYYKQSSKLNPIHREYQLLTDGVADSLPTLQLENKWIDSLVGEDSAGNRVPDPALPAKQKYGISYRPRQSMFVNRMAALKIAITSINNTLLIEPFADSINFENLNLVDLVPSSLLNLYDQVVDTEVDLINVGTVRTRRATLRANIVDGEIDTIDIIHPGFGYKVPPAVEIVGDGKGARAVVTLDNQGRINSVTVTLRGKKYSTASISVRHFSVLVNSDSTAKNYWSIYAWDDERKVFFRSQSQAFDTTRYWTYRDWWKEGFSTNDKIVKEIYSLIEEPTIRVNIGDLIRIKEYANGGWVVFKKIAEGNQTFLDNYEMVARENGTIQLKDILYNTVLSGQGYDNTQSFDTVAYDIENATELRNIFRAVKEDIFNGDYTIEWNKLFFKSIRYVFGEQHYVDWAFKTSFLNATHNIGSLEQKLNYKNDNLTSYQDYINEVKPYRTTVREYVSRYDTIEPVASAISDFDLPPVYSTVDGKIVPVSTNSVELSQYPWKWWADNSGYSITSIEVARGGSGYTSPPTVLITGNGSGAVAQAYMSNGSVVAVKVINPGSGYTKAPVVSLVGGNGSTADNALAVAILGDSKARTFDLSIKFDRISKEGIYENYSQSETFIATGLSSSFDLTYAPTRDKSKIRILKNGQVVLTNEYSISLFKSYTGTTYGLLKGKIVFAQVPSINDVIDVVYEKNDELLDAVNRIDKFYSPVLGMKGKDLGQLMTGIDFGGVQIQGTTFEVTGGWDALPWFTDSWDSVEASSDYYVVCDGSTGVITLPFVPADNQLITIYIKRVGQAASVRIDDMQYTSSWDSSMVTNPNAQMPTFVGDGSTAVVEIGQYIETAAGDILIFRPIESDGSVTINDPNLLDTKLSGGTLSAMSGAYSTATGTTSSEISIDGDKFISPDQVPSPEENVPGQVIEGVSIRVFNSDRSGAAPLNSRLIISDGITRTYDIGLEILETKSLLIYVDKIKRSLGSGNLEYSIDFITNTIEFVTAPSAGEVIELISIGLGGVELLDYQEFIADGDTKLFLTNANYNDTSSVFVTVNGIQPDASFVNSSDVIDVTNKAMVELGVTPEFRSVIKIVCIGAGADVDSSGLPIVRVNQQEFIIADSTRSFDLTGFVDLIRGSSLSSMVVDVNGSTLRGVDSTYSVYDGITNQFTLGTDPQEPAGAILTSNIRVFVNDTLRTFIQDYVYDGTTKLLTIEPSILNVGDVIKIETNFRTDYRIDGNNIIINDDVQLSNDDKLLVTWFSEYPSMQIVSNEYTGGKVKYKLSYNPLNSNYVWVYKNGTRLTKDIDYRIILPAGILYLTDTGTSDDVIRVVLFGDKIYKLPSAFEIHKDMLNVYHYKRFSLSDVVLAEPLNYYDQQIVVTDASTLFEPNPLRNISGVLFINGEKIEYLRKVGNTLSQLRRGSFGTSIGTVYAVGTSIVDVSQSETLPYSETQDREDFYSDGSSLLIGPLNFIPVKSSDSWNTTTIPADFGRCDQVEIFAAGRRLRKSEVSVYNEELGASSPSSDVLLEAEFSVDGNSAYIRLTSALPAGTRISVITRTGKLWYERSATSASKGITLLENDTAIANFIAQKTTKLPE